MTEAVVADFDEGGGEELGEALGHVDCATGVVGCFGLR